MSREDECRTRVVFKMTPEERGNNLVLESDCIAFLLDCPANPGFVLSYMHIGQHGEASIDFMNDCITASPEQYADLKKELEFIGYTLEVL